ncbi:SUKH-3 domain-containing protein [Dokdonia sp.]|uniref:SUKH-3 domain-containing protein n=1 Tax=Dokdonia sp. TaxID=2024995 RepID=UPI0032637798
MFTEELQNHLKEMGWEKGRKKEQFDAFMEQHNYPESIREFIREYGGLLITELIDEKYKQNVINKISLNPLDSDGMNADSVAKDWASDLDRELYVIGLYSPENFDIAVDENGAVYFLGEYCYCISSNIYQGVEAIIRIDFGSQLSTDQPDTTNGKWFDIKGKEVDFASYVFKYK